MTLEVDIRKKFKDFTLDVQFAAGDEVLGLLGASGCGKSLTMRCVAGIETPDEGRIVVNGEVFFDSAAKINLKPQQRKTALLFQNYMLFPNLTVEQNVAAGIPKDTSKAERDAIVLSELKRFDVPAFAKRYPAQLSGGQQQRVALARMLAARPGILMLDEPFSALDAHLKGVLEQNLARLFDAFDGTILYVSHDIDEAVRFCDRIAVVEKGHVMEIDENRELVDNPKSMAGLKLSGCKNAVEVERLNDTHVYCPQWGVKIAVPGGVPSDVRGIGIRAFNLRLVDAPGCNVYRVRVDRVSDSRFERMCMLSFIERDENAEPLVNAVDQEVHFLHQRMYWRVSMREAGAVLPEVGDELRIELPEDKLYVVCK